MRTGRKKFNDMFQIIKSSTLSGGWIDRLRKLPIGASRGPVRDLPGFLGCMEVLLY